ncbi:hypothetical protein J6590_099245 [Homalodisca vitripennis]|nr:hypothetical protein J6590_099245 [Homalodisca vitripennis]
MSDNCCVCSALCGESTDSIKCAGSCRREFHLNCVATKFPDSMKTRDSKKKWFCDECRKAKGTSSINSSKSGEQATTLTKEFMIGLIEAFKKEVFDELKSHSTQFQDFKTAFDFLSAKLDDSNKDMAEIQTQYKEIRRENEAFMVQNAQLSQWTLWRPRLSFSATDLPYINTLFQLF